MRGKTYNGLPTGGFLIARTLEWLEEVNTKKLFVFLFLVDPHELIGNLILLEVCWETTGKSWPRAAMAAVDHDFRRVLDLVTGDEVHRQPSVARITQDQPETCQQMTPAAVFCAERSPDETTMVFRSWLGTCPCQCMSVHSARCPNDAPPPHRPGEQWPVALWVPTSARGRNVARSSRRRRLAAVR